MHGSIGEIMKKSKFQFSNPCLINLVFSINDGFESSNFETLKMTGKTKILKSKEHNNAVVEFSIILGDKSTSSPYYINATMKSEFKWEEGLDEDAVDSLLKANAPSLILGYLRPIIANITNMSEYPVFNIPFIDMQANEADIEECE